MDSVNELSFLLFDFGVLSIIKFSANKYRIIIALTTQDIAVDALRIEQIGKMRKV